MIKSEIFEKTKQHAVEKTIFLQSQFKQHSSTAIIAGLSFVIALVWRDLVIKITNNILKPHLIQRYPYLSELITAIIVTLFAIVAIAFVSRWNKKSK